jgi:23S rRNA (uridine2552-2'-O)-methyltransferase
MVYKPNDHYARKAKKENFVARSVYKLEEIDQKYNIITRGNYILDLGASPGSWSQYASQKIGEKGLLIGVDLKPLEVKLFNGHFIEGDINSINLEDAIKVFISSSKFDCVLSDMAPNTSGNKFLDQTRSYDLCMMALLAAERFLKEGGSFVCKIFDGEDAMPFRDHLKTLFGQVHVARPKSVQSSSKEFFLVAKKFHQLIK